MSKITPLKAPIVDLSHFCSSTFTLTFAIEILGIDVWHDCNEGWVDLGPCVQGIKLQYQLYPGQNYDVDILIWPHVAKIWHGSYYGWVRTWQFLERRFFTFSIRHIFPVRVMDLRSFTTTITPTMGLASLGPIAKYDKNDEVFLPPLKFGEQRYFASVLDRELTLNEFLSGLLWNSVVKYIPTSNLDGLFDIPTPVTDIRHQDAIIYYVKESILNNVVVETEMLEPEETKTRNKKDSKILKDKDKEKKKTPEVAKIKFEIKLSGHSVLAGVGRVIPFEKVGDKPYELGEFITIISSTNLPAQDDHPIIFVNIETLFDAPIEYLKKLRISHLYTRWTIGEKVHDSALCELKANKTEIKFNDHYALPIKFDEVSHLLATFLDNPFEIQLRCIQSTTIQKETPTFFGYKKGDQNFGTSSRNLDSVDLDFIIAVTQIDAKSLSKGMNKFIRSEYPLYPPKVNVVDLEREEICTNDVNRIKALTSPIIAVPVHIVLEAQMTLGVSIGFVGCQPKKLSESFARLFCLIRDTKSVMTIIKNITEINDSILQSDAKDNVLTGFAVDVGSLVLLYVEGPSDGEILKVWETTEDFYLQVKPVYSSSNRYASRIYPELLLSIPFNVMKMFAPLAVVLACPPVYARPALPLPTRSAVMKLGRLIAGKLRMAPSRNEMPSTAELKSFRLELCVASKPLYVTQKDNTNAKDIGPNHQNTFLQRINWDKQDAKEVRREEK